MRPSRKASLSIPAPTVTREHSMDQRAQADNVLVFEWVDGVHGFRRSLTTRRGATLGALTQSGSVAAAWGCNRGVMRRATTVESEDSAQKGLHPRGHCRAAHGEPHQRGVRPDVLRQLGQPGIDRRYPRRVRWPVGERCLPGRPGRPGRRPHELAHQVGVRAGAVHKVGCNVHGWELPSGDGTFVLMRFARRLDGGWCRALR